MVVSRLPNSQKYQDLINKALADVGIDPGTVFHTAAIKCRNWDVEPGRKDEKACQTYLDAEIALIKPKWVLAFGNEALRATTGHSGITKYRGQVIERAGYSVIPTISPASVQRNPGQMAGWLGDLRLFARMVRGEAGRIEPPKIAVIDTAAKLMKLKRKLEGAQLLSYDVETVGEAEFVDGAAIVSLSGTSILHDGKMLVWALPLYHPQSPFRKSWQKALLSLRKVLEACPKQIAHNGKYDARWMRQFGLKDMSVTFDTMLACHILDENRAKGLKVLGTTILGVAPWGIDTKKLLETPIMEVLKYNALDTYYTYHIYLHFKAELLKQPQLARIFKYITMRSNDKLIQAELDGVWMDRERLATNTKIAQDLEAVELEKLMKWIPDPEYRCSEYCTHNWASQCDCQPCTWLRENTDFQHEPRCAYGWPRAGKRGKPADVNFNPSNWSRWFLFEYLDLPVLERGKDTEDGDPGKPSMAESVMLELKHQHEVPKIMLERTKWNKTSQFLTAYDENLDDNDRIHTTFKLAGTVTGRLSSGKEDEEKFNGAMKDRKGINLQQVPRDPFVRGLFGAPPGYLFVEADFSQVELRVVAFIAPERHMKYLYQTGQDIHRATASSVLGVPMDKVSKTDRKKAKAVNFGFVYGMGAKKFVTTAFNNYEVVFTLEEAEAVREAYFQQFPDLKQWHNRQRRLVRKYQRVQSPIGRIRHLPDIMSPDKGVQGEAERQAINSPVQSFASDMTQLSMVMVDNQFKKLGIDGKIIGTVHDASLFQVRQDQVGFAMPIIKDTMQNLPLERLFGVDIDIPIIADIKVGTHWGDAQELEEAQVYDWDEAIIAEILERRELALA